MKNIFPGHVHFCLAIGRWLGPIWNPVLGMKPCIRDWIEPGNGDIYPLLSEKFLSRFSISVYKVSLNLTFLPKNPSGLRTMGCSNLSIYYV